MLIQSDSIQAALTEKAQSYAKDSSRHLLCPTCRVRTKLYTLKDGRRKCSACGTKFNPEKKTDMVRLKQCADALLCFSINFTAQQASSLSGYRYRLVSALYDRFRLLLAEQTLDPHTLQRLPETDAYNHTLHDGRYGDSPIFGLQMHPDHHIAIHPLFRNTESPTIAAYAGYICKSAFHRFKEGNHGKDGAEQVWAWISERLRRHHGIWKRTVGLYLKELEWKYNNRALSSEAQALKIIALMPDDFLVSWSEKKKQ